MATWFEIPLNYNDPDRFIPSELANAWSYNVVAAFEGASGAPKLEFAALAPSFSTVGGIGSYAFLGRNISPGTYAAPGAVVAGADLKYASIQSAATATQVQLSATSPAGTWRCMGEMINASGTAANVATTWLRIS